MYLAIRKTVLVIFILLYCNFAFSQNGRKNNNSLEGGAIIAGDETIYYGIYSKYTVPLSQHKHYFTLGMSFAAYFDFKGESEPLAYLKNDVDMRLIPTINLGYSLNFGKVQLNFEIPVGASFAYTKGTLVNERAGFEIDYSNNEAFINYGLLFAPKYKINDTNYIGLYGFLPLIDDKAQSGYQFGIGWTKTFAN
ncbi:hypothetical protein [Flavobacterium aquicola]|uniref:Outer membrane protein with beta-barrel domain n=1 Tax=Flavobacterium aquicola TaxID=1682742 RepID=A0A3E0ENH2_9FLAO|nr:hypothetical protein [Flavobacterium aquicola]REG99655.1 hypothetical protein C8P67_104285 [Flavobacterium aquicola]